MIISILNYVAKNLITNDYLTNEMHKKKKIMEKDEKKYLFLLYNLHLIITTRLLPSYFQMHHVDF
jgi:hypothetical protein